MTTGVKSSTGKKSTPRRALRGRAWKFYLVLSAVVCLSVGSAVVGYYYVRFSHMIDARLGGELQRTDPRIFARPLTIRRGQRLTVVQMIDRLNDLGYAERPRVEQPGEFAIGRNALALIPRGGDHAGQTLRFVFSPPPRRAMRSKAVTDAPLSGGTLIDIQVVPAPRPPGERAPRPNQTKGPAAGDAKPADVTFEAPLITAVIEGREKRRDVPLSAMAKPVAEAVIAIEDRRFYEHPGVDPIGTTRAVLSDLFGRHSYMGGGSTITQQLVRNTFLSEMWGQEAATTKSLKRKFAEWLMSVALERRLSKDKILELYLNDVYLGQRGSFAIKGVPEAARLFFGKDVSNLSLVESALIAGVIQAPPRYSPFTNPDRAKERRNVVLRVMADTGIITPDAADRASREPVQVVQRALESEAPYFVDYVTQEVEEKTKLTGAVDVYTTLDLQLQRIAQDAVRSGLLRVDELLAHRRKRPPAEAALIAIDPRTGEILAMVGGRSYNQSQYNRAVNARRQPGSTFKPFVYLAAFERAKADGRTDLTPATIVDDEPTTFTFDQQTWAPTNYDNEYDGPITLRRALAMSRNVATVKVAETTGYDNVAALWKRIGVGTAPKPYPSIALGVFEATPLEMATAYTIFPNAGVLRPLRGIARIVSAGTDQPVTTQATRTIAQPDTTFLVTNMLRSVINEGTGASVRAAGFGLDAAGKTGTTNDLRDAWFVGFTPELLTVVWVGLDDNQVLGLSGAQAAVPIWTEFMARALAGHTDASFQVPDGITFADIDRDTGKLATPACPRVFHEGFLTGTQPTEFCPLHRF